MNTFRSRVANLLVSLVGILLVATFTAQPAYSISCGTEVRADLKLTADLGPCPGNGLIITDPLPGAPAFTVDLNGHSIRGSGSGDGLTIHSTGITVKGPGLIINFGNGINLSGSHGILIYDLLLSGNQTGFYLAFSNGLRILNNTVLRGQTGFALTDVGAATYIYQNVIAQNSVTGLWLGNTDATVDENMIWGNRTGIDVATIGVPHIRGNRITANQADGIDLQNQAEGCGYVEDNDITFNSGSGIVVMKNGRNCLIQNNIVSNNRANGISVMGGDGTQVLGNRVSRNGGVDLFWNGTATSCWNQNIFGKSSPATLPQCP